MTLLVIAALFLAGCSTVAARRDDPPIFVGSTGRSLVEFQGCFARQLDRETQPTFMPRGNGGTYTQTVNHYVTWVVDIDDLGHERRATIYAVDSIAGPNQRIVRQVQACL